MNQLLRRTKEGGGKKTNCQSKSPIVLSFQASSPNGDLNNLRRMKHHLKPELHNEVLNGCCQAGEQY